MKNTIILFLSLCSVVAFAQPDRDEPKRSEKVEALKRAYLTTELALTSVEAEKFWPVYNAHEETQKTHRKELKKVMEKMEAVGENQKAFESLNNEISALRMKEVEEDSNFMIACSKVIGVQKTAKLPSIEREFHKIVLEEVGKKGGRPGPPPGGRPPHGPRYRSME
ncbi:MAG: hypothetical protein RLZZ71_553 [Bacteroidota bacterium]|jgi:hypothetical protein